MSEISATYICPLCHASNPTTEAKCGCGYPILLKSGPTVPEQAKPHRQLWVASARHKAAGSLVAGWLVQATGYRIKVFDLFLGINEIGRPSDFIEPDILIEGDGLVSREHAVLECSVDERGRIEARITDKSTNGTYIEDEEEPTSPIILYDGVKITMGTSVFAYKSAQRAVDHMEALTQVNNSSKYGN